MLTHGSFCRGLCMCLGKLSMKQTSPGPGRIHLNMAEPQQALAGEQKRERARHGPLTLTVGLSVLLCLLFLASLLFLMPYNQWQFSLAWFLQSVSEHFASLFRLLNGQSEPGMAGRIWQLLVVILTGMALASTGAVFQGSFRNVLAGPSTMGVMSGGTLGCTLYLWFFVSPSAVITYTSAGSQTYASPDFWALYGQPVCTMIGCFASVFLVMGISQAAGRGRVSAPAMLLAGMTLSTLAGTVSGILRYYMILTDASDVRIEALEDLMMGSLDGTGNAATFFMMAIPVGLCLAALLFLRGRLSLLGLGEDEAQSIGVDYRFYRLLVVGIGTILTGVVTAFCGHIGFLGFMVPLIARRLAGPDLRRMLPVAMLTGAILFLLIFDAAYFCTMTDSLNLFTSCIGCLVMAAVLLRKGERRGEAFQSSTTANMGL